MSRKVEKKEKAISEEYLVGDKKKLILVEILPTQIVKAQEGKFFYNLTPNVVRKPTKGKKPRPKLVGTAKVNLLSILRRYTPLTDEEGRAYTDGAYGPSQMGEKDDKPYQLAGARYDPTYVFIPKLRIAGRQVDVDKYLERFGGADEKDIRGIRDFVSPEGEVILKGSLKKEYQELDKIQKETKKLREEMRVTERDFTLFMTLTSPEALREGYVEIDPTFKPREVTNRNRLSAFEKYVQIADMDKAGEFKAIKRTPMLVVSGYAEDPEGRRRVLRVTEYRTESRSIIVPKLKKEVRDAGIPWIPIGSSDIDSYELAVRQIYRGYAKSFSKDPDLTEEEREAIKEGIEALIEEAVTAYEEEAEKREATREKEKRRKERMRAEKKKGKAKKTTRRRKASSSSGSSSSSEEETKKKGKGTTSKRRPVGK